MTKNNPYKLSVDYLKSNTIFWYLEKKEIKYHAEVIYFNGQASEINFFFSIPEDEAVMLILSLNVELKKLSIFPTETRILK